MSTWVAPPGWRKLREQVFARMGRQCWKCGRPASTVDHILPRALGGGHELSNLAPCCASCNYSSGAALGNRLRPPRPLTADQRRAIGLRKAGKGRARGPAPAVQPSARPESWRSARNW